MRCAVVVGALIAAAGGVAADPARPSKVFGGVAISLQSDGPNGGMIEAGYRAWPAPVWIRGSYAGGSYYFTGDAGSVFQIAAGAEARLCTRAAGACGVAIADVGFRSADPSEILPRERGLVALPRLGLDAGGDDVRFRLAVGAPITFGFRTYQQGHDADPTHATGGEATRVGISIVIGAALQI